MFIQELLVAQLTEPLCSDFCPRLNGGERIAVEIVDNGIIFRTGDKGNKIFAPHSMNKFIRHIKHYSNLTGHPGGRKLYYPIRKYF